MIYKNWAVYKYYLNWVRKGLRDRYLHQLKRGERPLFIHINRTGGTSISEGLGISPIHFSLKEYEELWQLKYGEALPVMTVYSCVRNPYHRAVSQYYFRIKSGQNNMHKHHIDFDDWLHEVHQNRNPKYRDRELMFQTQTAWLESSIERPKEIIHFENLEEEYQRTFAAFDPKPLPWRRPSNRPDYQRVLTKEAKALLAEVYKQDFENFNYNI